MKPQIRPHGLQHSLRGRNVIGVCINVPCDKKWERGKTIECFEGGQEESVGATSWCSASVAIGPTVHVAVVVRETSIYSAACDLYTPRLVSLSKLIYVERGLRGRSRVLDECGHAR